MIRSHLLLSKTVRRLTRPPMMMSRSVALVWQQQQRSPFCLRHSSLALRSLASDSNSNNKQQQQQDSQSNNNESNDKELILTPGEKVVVAGRLSLWLGIGTFAAVCAYYIGKELLPT